VRVLVQYQLIKHRITVTTKEEPQTQRTTQKSTRAMQSLFICAISTLVSDAPPLFSPRAPRHHVATAVYGVQT
jgi:hypothetical protein